MTIISRASRPGRKVGRFAVLIALAYGMTAGLLLFLPPNNTVAQPPPLTQGCYYRAGDRNFERMTCPTENYARLTSGTRGHCYMTRDRNSTIMFHVHCGSGDATEVMARNAHNLRQAQNICQAVEGNSYWSPTTRTCNWGTSCVTAGPSTGTGCETMTPRQTFHGYVSSSLPLPGGSSSSSGSTGGSAGSTSSSSGGTTTYTPSESVTQRDSCIQGGREWVQNEENPDDPTDGVCRAYQSKTTNDCQGPSVTSGLGESDENHCGILNYIAIFIDALAVLAGIVITASLIVAGMQYSSAGSDPQKVSAAKSRIRNSVIALLLLIFGYALLSYLVPGGIL